MTFLGHKAREWSLLYIDWLVVWNMNLIFHHIWDNPSQLTNIFQDGWNQQPVDDETESVKQEEP